MSKFIRYLLITVGIVVLLPVLAIGIFVAVFDANAYKQDLSDWVRQETGRELRFDGDVSLTFFPALGMKLGGVSFANPVSFGDGPMVLTLEGQYIVKNLVLISGAMVVGATVRKSSSQPTESPVSVIDDSTGAMRTSVRPENLAALRTPC